MIGRLCFFRLRKIAISFFKNCSSSESVGDSHSEILIKRCSKNIQITIYLTHNILQGLEKKKCFNAGLYGGLAWGSRYDNGLNGDLNDKGGNMAILTAVKEKDKL